jgi:hypothetical protein
MKIFITIFCIILLSEFSLTQKDPISHDTLNLFNIQFVDSVENYLLLGQEDLILNIYIVINPLSYDFITCLNCKENELKYLNIEKIKKKYFTINNKTDFKSSTKEFKFLLQINSIENLYDCKLLL